ncbi:MAG: flagellar protein FlaG [Candidatus Wallbacteria bacterium]
MMINAIDSQVNFIQPSMGVKNLERDDKRNDSVSNLNINEEIKNRIEEKKAEKQKPEKVDVNSISDAVEKANKLVLIFDQSIKFTFNPKIGDNYVDIIDNKTNEVIRKIPSEEMRNFLESVANAVGIIVDKKV